jgi:hypothetical protein
MTSNVMSRRSVLSSMIISFFILASLSITINGEHSLTNENSVEYSSLPLDQSQVEEVKKNLTERFERTFLQSPNQFYNYSIMCPGTKNRVRDVGQIDSTIPEKYHAMIMNTLSKKEQMSINRKDTNACPKWQANVQIENGKAKSGGMETLVLEENTKVGTVVFKLNAADKEPLIYYIRKAEKEVTLEKLKHFHF